MRLIHLCIALTYLLMLLGTLAGLLLGARSFTQGQRKKYPVLRKLDGKQLHLLTAALLFFGGAFLTNILKDFLSLQPATELVRGPEGQFTRKATSSSIREELRDAAAELASKAEDYFNAAERDYAVNRYRDAAKNYQNATEVLPTMSAYLNLGNSFFYISDNKRAQTAYFSGLQLADRKNAEEFKGAFLSGIANTYLIEGKFGEALSNYQAALEIDKKSSNTSYQASHLNSIGNVHFQWGQYEKALKAYEQALEINKQVENFQGQANSLGNMGIIKANQGELREALDLHQKALELHKRSDDILGQANDLGNIGNVYGKQGDTEDALKYHNAALEGHIKIENKRGQAIDYANIGSVFTDKGNLDEGISYFQRAIELHKEVGNIGGQARSLAKMGLNYSRQNKKQEALEKYKQARVLFQDIGDKDSVMRLDSLIEELISPARANR